MHMKNQPQRRFDIDMHFVEGYQFQTQAHEGQQLHGAPFLSDEPDPVGAASAPATPALLATAVAHCLSASLLETGRRARVPITGIRTRATAVVEPNAEGNPRIARIEVDLAPSLEHDHPRKQRCEEVFQNYCTVSSSLKSAIDIDVNVRWLISAPVNATTE